MESKKVKVFGLGFQKTGTSSLHQAMEELGYEVCGTRPDLLLPILKGRNEKIFKITRRYDAFFDHPWPQLFQMVDDHFPGSKFILTLRNDEEWYNSVSQHIGDYKAPIHEWIYGRGYGLPKYNKTHTIEIYNTHNQKVLEYFNSRPGDLLILNMPDELIWDKLCAFLNCPVPNKPFPKANVTNYGEQSGNFTRLGIYKYYKRLIKNKIMLRYLTFKKLI